MSCAGHLLEARAKALMQKTPYGYMRTYPYGEKEDGCERK